MSKEELESYLAAESSAESEEVVPPYSHFSEAWLLAQALAPVPLPGPASVLLAPLHSQQLQDL